MLIDHLLYPPESTIRGDLPSSVDPSRVVDQSRANELVSIITSIFDADPMPGGDKQPDALEIHNYLTQREVKFS